MGLAEEEPNGVLIVGANPVARAVGLALNRAGLVVFLHPETGDVLADHTEHAIWMGAKLELDT